MSTTPTRTAQRMAQAQDAQRRAEQELHANKMRIVTLESDLTNAKDLLARRDNEIDRLREIATNSSAAASNSGANSASAAADRARLRDEAVKMQWFREMALLELQEQIARGVMLDAARDESFDMFSEAFVEIGKQQGDEAATERLRHRINTLLFQLRITQSVQIKKLREQIAQLSAKLTEAEQNIAAASAAVSANNTPDKRKASASIAVGSDSNNTNSTTNIIIPTNSSSTQTAAVAVAVEPVPVPQSISIPPGSVVLTENEKNELIQSEVKKQVLEQTAALKKELAQAEKARLELAGRFSDTSREMREHRQNSLTALNEAQKWEAEAKKLKSQLRDLQQEMKNADFERQQQLQREKEAADAKAASLGRDDSPRERDATNATTAMEHHRELSELQLLVDDLQSQVASSQMRLQETERKLRNERDRANMASSRCSQLEDEIAVLQSGGSAPGEHITALQQELEALSNKAAEQRIALNTEKQANEKAQRDKDQTIAQLERHVAALQQQAAEAARRGSEPSPETMEHINELRNKLADAERSFRNEKAAHERDNTTSSSKIADLENRLATKESVIAAEREQQHEAAQRTSGLEAQNNQLQHQLNKAEGQNLDLERKLRVTQRQADELERDLAIKVEQFALLSQQNANTNVQKEQLGKAQVKLDGARHSITMLLLSQQYLAALIDLFAESVTASTEEARIAREAKLVRDLQNKHRDQVQSQQLQHAAQMEEMKSRFARQHRLDSDLLLSSPTSNGNNNNNNNNNTNPSSPGSPSYGANEGTGLVFGVSSPLSRSNTNNNNNNNSSNNNGIVDRNLDVQISLERKAFAYLSAMDLVAAHSISVTRLYLDSFVLANSRENDQLHRKIREQQTDRNSAVSNLDSKLQILQTEKSGLQSQLNNTQARLEERVAHLSAEVKDAARREKELRERADAAESEQRKLQSRVSSLQQELAQLEDYAEDLKTSREMERSVLHARIQAAEEASNHNRAHLDAANANASTSVSELAAALEAANLQIAREHSQVVELEGSISELKSGMLKERRSRAALEATHREEIAVLEQRLGEVRAELAALQLQRDPMMLGEDGGLSASEFSRPHLQRELKSANEKLSLANVEASAAQERCRELERKLAAERDHNASSKDTIAGLETDLESTRRASLDARKELDEARAKHATELVVREGEFDRARQKLLAQINTMQEELSALKLQQHSQQMDHMSELHKVERHALDRIAAAEGEAASSNRQMFEELQERKERVAVLEKKLASVAGQLENRDQLLKAARDHIETLQTEQRKKAGSDDDELAHYRQELRDLSNALVDAKRAHIAAADRSRQIMSHTDAELSELRNEVTALRADVVELESKHRAEILMKDATHGNEAKELKNARELIGEFRDKISKMEKEHSAESTELRKRIEGLLQQVATEDVMEQLKQTQRRAEIEKQRCKEAEEFTEVIRQKNNALEAECERLRVHAKQVQMETDETLIKLQVAEASIDKKVDQVAQMMQRKVEVEAQLWEAKASSTQAENSQLRRLLLEEQRTSNEAAQRIVQLESALDDLELEMIQKTVVNNAIIMQQQQQQQNQNNYSYSPTRALLNNNNNFDSSSSPITKSTNVNYITVPIDVNGREEYLQVAMPVSNVRQRLIELPSLAQVIGAKQSSRLEIERLEYERRTEIEADVFEWRWAIASFANLLQSVFHSFTIQLIRASDHAASIETEVNELESDVRASLIVAQRKNTDYEVELAKWKICHEESENRLALARFESYQWVDATRMLARELANHAKMLTNSNKRLLTTNAALQQQQRDIFLFHRKQLQDFEKESRHQITFAIGQTYGFYHQMFIFARTVMHSYERKTRTLDRRLELMVSSERSISDVNISILTRKHQQQQQLVLQHQKARQDQFDLYQHQRQLGLSVAATNNNNNSASSNTVSPFAPASSLLFGNNQDGNRENVFNIGGQRNNTNNNNNTTNSLDVNLRALPEFKRPDLSLTPMEIIQRDELVQRRILQDLCLDWITSSMMLVCSRAGLSGGRYVMQSMFNIGSNNNNQNGSPMKSSASSNQNSPTRRGNTSPTFQQQQQYREMMMARQQQQQQQQQQQVRR